MEKFKEIITDAEELEQSLPSGEELKGVTEWKDPMIHKVPAALNESSFLTIKEMLLSGATWKNIAHTLGVSTKTIDAWWYTNYDNFQDKLEEIRHEKLLKLSVFTIEQLLLSAKSESVRADLAKFVAERIGQKRWKQTKEVEHLLGVKLYKISESPNESKISKPLEQEISKPS